MLKMNDVDWDYDKVNHYCTLIDAFWSRCNNVVKISNLKPKSKNLPKPAIKPCYQRSETEIYDVWPDKGTIGLRPRTRSDFKEEHRICWRPEQSMQRRDRFHPLPIQF